MANGSPWHRKNYQKLGTASLVETTNSLGALPTRNFSTGSFVDYKNITGETRFEEEIQERGGEGSTTHACMPGCIIRCSNIYADKAGKRIQSTRI
ncbi:hypothetical protein KHA80_22075 [Anaerobacillus sp. HL2]|nr:hypothetical protein KHA80_22075 [Anaerobacillus sp. HL2]